MSDDNSHSVDEKNDYSSSDNDCFFFEGYFNEPQYSKAELDAMNFNNVEDESESESSNEENLDSSRLKNMYWCICQECSIMPSLVESKCCRETISLLNDKLEGISASQATKTLKFFV